MTTSQMVAFFENGNQMGIPHDTVTQMAQEGIVTIGDLIEFDRQPLQRIADNLRRPGGRIADPTPGATTGSTIPTSPFVFWSKP